MRMYRPWGYIIQSSFSSFTGLKAVSCATGILNTAHRAIKITGMQLSDLHEIDSVCMDSNRTLVA